jgi:hypothetical protein
VRQKNKRASDETPYSHFGNFFNMTTSPGDIFTPAAVLARQTLFAEGEAAAGDRLAAGSSGGAA